MLSRSLLFLVLLCFSGCSVNHRYYLRNLLNEPVTIIIEHAFEMSDETLKFSYPFDNRVYDIKYSTYKHLTQQLEVKKIDSKKVQIIAPPQSTIFFAFGGNSKIADVKSVEIKTSTSTIILDPEKTRLKVKGGFGKYAMYYDIGDTK